uniref:Fe2OG dioxygenase domain-containing protein n=1 Tax=Timema monikensis TaxID=170555 RepID=A0A7R9E351_9NEOP|nr:unnamed protein product [Timema monikensis]
MASLVLTDSSQLISDNQDLGQSLKLRKVKHFGYEFHYDINNVHKDSPLTQNIPEECSILLPRLKERNCNVMSLPPDQLTVNQYQPGQGIPSHVDTHSAFEDPILSLSLGAPVVMEFKYQEGRNVPVYLPQRSLLVMSGESRYLWSHGISPRKTDIVPTPCGTLSVHNRGIRTSFTFRRVRQGECDCNYHDQCDSYQRNKTLSGKNSESNKIAAELEAHHVLQVYEEIADHFSDTRHKPWPNVLSFVQSLPPGALLVDVGCGNGKYFGHNSAIYEVGCDSSFGLAQVCRERGFQVFNCNCLALPLRSGIADGCIRTQIKSIERNSSYSAFWWQGFNLCLG